MEIQKVKIKELNSPEWNPRKITENEKKKLMNSLETFGYIDPIIVNKHNMNIVGGNQRYHAMRELGWDEVDVVFIDEPNLDKEKAMNIALNKISGEWDMEKLVEITDELKLNEFVDVDLTGFEEAELDEIKLKSGLVYKEDDFSEDDIESMYEEPKTKKIICPNCGYEDEKNKFLSA